MNRGAFDDCGAKNSLAAASFSVQPEKRFRFGEPGSVALAFGKPVSCSSFVTFACPVMIRPGVCDCEPLKDSILQLLYQSGQPILARLCKILLCSSISNREN
jgi:hypothetical protein